MAAAIFAGQVAAHEVEQRRQADPREADQGGREREPELGRVVDLVHRRRRHRLQEVVQAVRLRHAHELAVHVGQADEPAERREDRQHHERRHDPALRLVHVIAGVVVGARLAGEHQVVEPEHVERGEAGGHQQHQPDPRVARESACASCAASRISSFEKKPENGGTPRDREHADQEREPRPRHARAQAAHLHDVLLVVHAQDHRARAQEEQRLEEGVRHQVEHRGAVAGDARRHEHEAELAHGGVREHLLDVGLRDADRGREEARWRRRSTRPSPARPARASTRTTCGRSCTRPRSPWSRRGSGPRPASGRPSRRAATRRAGSAPTCRTRRRTGTGTRA